MRSSFYKNTFNVFILNKTISRPRSKILTLEMSHCGIYQWFAIAYNNLSKKCSFLFFCIICRFLQNLLLKPLSIYIDKQNIDNYHFHEFNFKKNLKTSNSNVNHQFIMIRSLDNILLPFATALLPPHHLSYHYLQFRLQLG
jgi:hypothetical protein